MPMDRNSDAWAVAHSIEPMEINMASGLIEDFEAGAPQSSDGIFPGYAGQARH